MRSCWREQNCDESVEKAIVKEKWFLICFLDRKWNKRVIYFSLPTDWRREIRIQKMKNVYIKTTYYVCNCFQLVNLLVKYSISACFLVTQMLHGKIMNLVYVWWFKMIALIANNSFIVKNDRKKHFRHNTEGPFAYFITVLCVSY